MVDFSPMNSSYRIELFGAQFIEYFGLKIVNDLESLTRAIILYVSRFRAEKNVKDSDVEDFYRVLKFPCITRVTDRHGLFAE